MIYNDVRNFPKVFNIETANIPKIFNGFESDANVPNNYDYASLKVDGSYFGFYLDNDGSLNFRSKNTQINYPDNVPKMFKSSVEYILSIKDRLTPNLVYSCELLSKKKHNSITYDRLPKNNLVLFNLYDLNNQIYVDPVTYYHIYDEESHGILDVDLTKFWDSSMFTTVEECKDYIHNNSDPLLGGDIVEGLVLVQNKPLLINDKYIQDLNIQKVVNDKFKEINDKTWKNQKSTNHKFKGIVDNYSTENRFNKALQHLNELELLTGEMKDLQLLVPEIMNDLYEEAEDNIKNDIFKLYRRDFEKIFTKKIPIWYKTLLEDKP